MAFQDTHYGDIRATLAISQYEARNGGSRVVNLPGGRAVTVTVPAGINDGEEIRLRGQGDAGSPGGVAGDLILRVSVIAAERIENQGSAEQSMPTEALPLSALPPQPPVHTEYAAGGSGYAPPAGTYYPNVPATEAMGAYTPPPSTYPSAPGGPQSYPNYPMYGQPAQQEQAYPPSYYPPLSMPQQPQRKRSGAGLAVVIVMLLVLLSGSGLLFYFGYYQPAQVHTAATATASAQVFGTAQARATGTAQVAQATANTAASATAQVQATAQSYQSIYTQATSGTPVLNDAMSSQSGSQWETLTSSVDGTCGFSRGSYHSYMPKAGYFQPCFARNSSFSNFAYQVNMTIAQGDEGGLIFRADELNNKLYLFRISASGAYNLYLYVNNQGEQAKALISGNTSLMKPSGQSNEITVVAQGSTIYFYLNKQYLDNTTDLTYTTGMIGVFGESKTQVTDVAFSNIKVWTLS